jgi:hypothetical protein
VHSKRDRKTTRGGADGDEGEEDDDDDDQAEGNQKARFGKADLGNRGRSPR